MAEPPDQPGTPFVERHHLGLGVDYALRLMCMVSDLFEGDIVQGLVFMAAVRASTQHIIAGKHPALVAGQIFPDEDRRPCSLSAIARSLGLSVETTRRHVVKLTDRGYLARSSNGAVLIVHGVLERGEFRQAAFANATNLEQLVRGVLRTATQQQSLLGERQ